MAAAPLAAKWADPDWWAEVTPVAVTPVAAPRTPRRAATPPPGFAVSHDGGASPWPSSPRSLKPPLPDEVRYGMTSPRSATPPPRHESQISQQYHALVSSPSSPPTPSTLGEVRPQWTTRTTAGRAKLAVDTDNWLWAERTRKLRNQREAYRGQWQHHVRAKNAYEASAAREDRLSSLRSVRDDQVKSVDVRGKVGKREADLLRQKHHEQRQQWEAYGKDLHHVHNNDGARKQKVMLFEERRQESDRMKREREQHERARAAEISERMLANRQRAAHIRRENVRAVSSVSAAELRARGETYSAMRSQSVRHERQREHERQRSLNEAAWKRDAVHQASSREMVAAFNGAERRRKAIAATQVREQMQRMRRSRMHDVLSEADRKRALHDEVVRERLEGPAGSPPWSRGPQASPYGHVLGVELEAAVKRVQGDGRSVSPPDGRRRIAYVPEPPPPPAHYHDVPERRNDRPPHYLDGGIDDPHARRHRSPPPPRASTPPPRAPSPAGRHFSGYQTSSHHPEYAHRHDYVPYETEAAEPRAATDTRARYLFETFGGYESA